MSPSGRPASRDTVVVQAAGGVVWRTGAGSTSGSTADSAREDLLEIAVVHRQHRSDWSLPKGHLEVGEEALDAAVREVLEETGLHCEVGEDLGEVRYVDHRQRRKVVRYWAMRQVAGRFVPNDEVDELCWSTVVAANRLLTYDTDRVVLSRFGAVFGIA